MPFIEQLGQQALGQIMGIGLGGINDRRQINQQRNLNVLEREQMDYAMKKQFEMWQKTGYVGQTEQMKKAGLNPALLYGIGGAGGGTTGTPGGSHTAATGHSGEAMGIGLAAANLGLLKAQKENIEADTANKKATTTKTSGIDTEEATARTASTAMDVKLKQIDAEFQENTRGNREDLIAQELNIRKEQLQIIENDATISEETKNDTIKRIKAEAAQAVLEKARIVADTLLKGAQKDAAIKSIAVMTQEIKTLINNRHLGWAQLSEGWINRMSNNEGENNVYNIPIIGGILKDVTQFIEEKPRKPIGFKIK